LLNGVYSSEHKTDNKRQRVELPFEASIEGGHSLKKLLIAVIDNIRLTFSHDVHAIIQNDTFEKLSEPISNLVTLVGLDKHYKGFIED